MKTAQKIGPRRLLGALIATTALLALIAPASALSAPVLGVGVSNQPTEGIAPDTHGKYTIAVSNTGTTSTTALTTVDFTVPVGLNITSVTDEFASNPSINAPFWDCAIAGDSQSVSCTGLDPNGTFGGPYPIPAGDEACVFFALGTCRIVVTVKADAGAVVGPLSPDPAIEVCGGGAAACANATVPVQIVPFDFHLVSFDGTALKSNGDPATEAGSQPTNAQTTFYTNRIVTPGGTDSTTDTIKDVTVDLPPGLLGNPQSVSICEMVDFARVPTRDCPLESQVGVVDVHRLGNGPGGSPDTISMPIYNLEPPQGTAALFGFSLINSFPAYAAAEVRTNGDYGATVSSAGINQFFAIEGVTFTVWGVPADSSHDSLRGPCFTETTGKLIGGCSASSPVAASPKSFFTLPTSCVGPGPNNSLETGIDVTTWEGSEDSSSFFSHDNTMPIPNPLGITDCNSLDFRPTLQARPTTNAADSPSGLDVDLHIPQASNDCTPGAPPTCPRAAAHLKDTTLILPEGLTVNPSGANGLDGCSPSEAGLLTPVGSTPIHFSDQPTNCPAPAKIGTVEVITPLLDHPVPGALYIADPHNNPFRSLLALYLTVNDPQSGTAATLAGEVHADGATGQLTTVFNDNPQLPIENINVKVFGGPHGSLRTPATCGTYEARATLTPWSAAGGAGGVPVGKSDAWNIAQNPAGGACPTSPGAQPHAPSFDAGTVFPIAGAHSPFVVKLRREDGSQNFSALTVKPPQGLVAKLAGTAICSDAALTAAGTKSGAGEKASPSCPAASEVGNVTAGAGAGPAPYYAPGKAYMSGPYKGAPLSLAIVTPATAGPFDLGTIVVKTALHVDPKTAEITAVSDPIPHILQGIPLDVKSIDVALDKPNFALNPTSCNPMAVTGQLLSTIGQLANLEARFQLGECGRLGFAPKLAIRLKGGTARGKHPQLSAYVIPREGDANIRSVSVSFPRSEFLENAHIRTICTRPDFAADNCPAGAVYGTSTVYTPLLDYPLTGNVYLRSSDNLLPDVVPDLRGPAWQPIKVEAAGRTDSVRGGIRNTFDFFPDAPFSKAVLKMQGGNKGLLVNSRNICARTYRAVVKFTAHNGDRITRRPKVKAIDCKNKRKRKAKRNGHKRGGKRVALSARASVR